MPTPMIEIVKEKMIISRPGNLFKIMSVRAATTPNNIVSHMSGIEGPKKERNYQ
jgi:hypothetical protein